MSDLICPCCGKPLPNIDALISDAAARILVCKGHLAKLTPQEWNVFEILFKHHGNIVTKDRVYDYMVETVHEDEWPEPTIMHVLICRLRKKLAPLGVSIDTAWGTGYRIVMKAEAAA